MSTSASASSIVDRARQAQVAEQDEVVSYMRLAREAQYCPWYHVEAVYHAKRAAAWGRIIKAARALAA